VRRVLGALQSVFLITHYEARRFSLSLCSPLCSFPVCLVRLYLSPVGYIAAVAAVELLGNAVVTSGTPTPIVLFGFHYFGLSFIFAWVLFAIIIAKLATSATT
jgi:hypothetical protein